MREKQNKGFTLVELIIVIAIMAILASAITLAVIRYIEKARLAVDKERAHNAFVCASLEWENGDLFEQYDSNHEDGEYYAYYDAETDSMKPVNKNSFSSMDVKASIQANVRGPV